MPGSSATIPSPDTFPATTKENLQRRRTNRGFTLVELMVSMAVTLIVLGTALTVFKKSMDAATTVTAKAEMQANARAAINGIVRELSQAGSGGMTWGGINGIPVVSLITHGKTRLE